MKPDTSAALAALRANPVPCPHCDRAFMRNLIGPHARACDPVERERRRIRQRDHAREVRRRPDYVRPPDPKEPCPECGEQKTLSAALCKSCDPHRPRPTVPVEERFWAMVDRSAGPSACWPWTGARSVHGYGRFNVGGGRTVTTSRYVLEMTDGPIPDGLGALHRCDNPPCCNPAHLYVGAQVENIRDAQARGRLRIGERHVLAVLTAEAVADIRRRWRPRTAMTRILAELYGVNTNVIVRAARGLTYPDVPVPPVADDLKRRAA